MGGKEHLSAMIQKTAQNIAESTSEIIGYGVLVTDEKGVIIGCSDVKRVGALHDPSLEVMESKQPMPTSKEEASQMAGVRSGYTCPIVISDVVVGTISIAGPPGKVERYGLLVQKHAEIMLKEQNILEMQLYREQAIRDLAQSVLLYKPEDRNEKNLLLHARELGYNLERCHIAVVVKITLRGRDDLWLEKTALQQIRNFFPDPAHLIALLPNFQIILFLTLRSFRSDAKDKEMEATELCHGLLEKLNASGVRASIGVGMEAADLSTLAISARSAREALHVGEIFENENVHSARNLEVMRLLASLPKKRRERCIEQVLAPLEKIDAGGELAETFLAWCKNPFAPREVAEKLAIHRNTLQYRLRKIRETVRLNPWNFHDGFTLWIALTLEKLEKNEIYCAPD